MVAVANSCVIDAVNELLGHLHSYPAWTRSLAGQRFVAFGRIARVKHPPVVDDLHFDTVMPRSDANLDVMRIWLGPRVLDDVADQLIERDLQLKQ